MILCDPLGSWLGWDLGAQDAHLRDVAGLLKVYLDGLHLVSDAGAQHRYISAWSGRKRMRPKVQVPRNNAEAIHLVLGYSAELLSQHGLV